MISTASVTVLRLGHGQPHLVKLNDTGRLEFPPGKKKRTKQR
jgi:hypothetical protein